MPQSDLPAVGPEPAETLGTVTLGAEGAEGTVFLRDPYRGDRCNFGAIADEVAAGAVATVRAIFEQCIGGPAGGAVYLLQVGAIEGYLLVDDTHDFVPVEVEPVAQGPTEGQGERSVFEARCSRASAPSRCWSSPPWTRSWRARRCATRWWRWRWRRCSSWATLPSPSPRYRAPSATPPARSSRCCTTWRSSWARFSLFGKLFGIEINLMFVTGLLTVIGFSVHDSIVVFDRVRENVTQAPDAPLAESVNAALVQTLARSFNTSVTLLLTVLALLLLGGVTIQSFLLVILVGVVAGTYSSVGVAAQLLVAWEGGDFGRWLRLRRGREEPAPAA